LSESSRVHNELSRGFQKGVTSDVSF